MKMPPRTRISYANLGGLEKVVAHEGNHGTHPAGWVILNGQVKQLKKKHRRKRRVACS